MTYPIFDETAELERKISELKSKRNTLIGKARAALKQEIQHLMAHGSKKEITEFLSPLYWDRPDYISDFEIRDAVGNIPKDHMDEQDLAYGAIWENVYVLPIPWEVKCPFCDKKHEIEIEGHGQKVYGNRFDKCPHCGKTTHDYIHQRRTEEMV